MGTTFVCFNLKSISSSVDSNSILEKDYTLVYKPLIKFLYAHEDFPFSFSFTGRQLDFFKKHSEFFSILRELLERKQIEVLGGGYHDPIMPLICPADRNGQIDTLSTEIRQFLGKRPRGITLHSDIWDTSLVNNINTCGIEYVLLDSSLVPKSKQIFLPLIMTDLGKSVDIFPYYNSLNPSAEMEPSEFIENILNKVNDAEIKSPVFQEEPAHVVSINLCHDEMYHLGTSCWFEKLYDYLKTIDNVKLGTPYFFRKDFKLKVPAYISAGINSSIGKYIDSPFKINSSECSGGKTVFDFLETYHVNHNLYCRMMYISMLVNQYKNDKVRKKVARDNLWQAQNGNGYIWSDIDVRSNFKSRQKAYRNLMDAEIILREDRKFKEAVNSFDYNDDGFNEYVCRMDDYFSYISLIGGTIRELELLKNTGNYVDNLSRIADFDGCSDFYERGLFVDHIFTNQQFDDYVNNKYSGKGLFSNLLYNELKYSQSKREIQLGASAVLKETNQKVFLKKKYIIYSAGVYVQYILKNESNEKLKVKFAVECNFACLNYNLGNQDFYNLDLVANNERVSRNDGDTLYASNNGNALDCVSFVRVTDIDNSISFVFEPNEKCGYCYNSIEFLRPNYKGENIPVEKTFVSTLFWDVEIEPGMETEKNINFTITAKKDKKN